MTKLLAIQKEMSIRNRLYHPDHALHRPICDVCKGTGIMTGTQIKPMNVTCPKCNGKGEYQAQPCLCDIDHLDNVIKPIHLLEGNSTPSGAPYTFHMEYSKDNLSVKTSEYEACPGVKLTKEIRKI